jgi:diacylglycerol kinase (ATP)
MLDYLKKRIAAFGYSFKGLSDLLRNHPHIHIHAVATVLVVAMGFYLKIDRVEWMAIVFACGIVWTAEAFNTSLEYLTDLVSPDFHPLAGKVKDVASAAVLISCIAATLIGGIVFFPYLWQ